VKQVPRASCKSTSESGLGRRNGTHRTSATPKGRPPFRQWQLKIKAPGVQQVALKDRLTGQLQLLVKAKK